MKTKHKISLAKFAYYPIHAIRATFGVGDRIRAKRGGVCYDLDISQGIDFSIFLLGKFEPSTTRALKRLIRPGFIVIDVGANIGAHTFNMARSVGPSGHVVAFEPTDFAFRKLVRNLELNPDLRSRMTLVQCFLGAEAMAKAPAAVYSRWSLVGNADRHAKHLGEMEGAANAKASSLDAMITGLPKVDLVKLDVDGFECDVLAGARNLLTHHRPLFVMELTPYVLSERGCSLNMILDVFRSHDYELLDETSMAAIAMDAGELESMIGEGAGKNVVFRPRIQHVSPRAIA